MRGARPGKNVQLSEGEIRGLCLKSREIFLSQPVLLELEAPLKICGEYLHHLRLDVVLTRPLAIHPYHYYFYCILTRNIGYCTQCVVWIYFGCVIYLSNNMECKYFDLCMPPNKYNAVVVFVLLRYRYNKLSESYCMLHRLIFNTF